MNKHSAHISNQLFKLKLLPDSKRSNSRLDFVIKLTRLPKSKRSMELAIPFLVLMTLVLTISALVIFNFNSRSVGTKIEDYRLLDDINIRERQVNFYIKDIVESSISGIQKGKDVKTQFIENFNEELKRYKNVETFYVKELEQLPSQVNRDKIKIEDKKISIVFKIEIGREFPDKITVIYSYEKEFYGFLS